jgi:hypothetical protein
VQHDGVFLLADVFAVLRSDRSFSHAAWGHTRQGCCKQFRRQRWHPQFDPTGRITLKLQGLPLVEIPAC